MANAGDLIHKFCEETGRHDLCADFANADYTDRGALYYLNAGIEMLDRRFFRFLGADTLLYLTLSAEDYILSIPRARTINYVRFRPTSADDSSWVKLVSKTRDELLLIYPSEYSEVELAEPIYYLRTGDTVAIADSSAVYLRIDGTGLIDITTQRGAIWKALVLFNVWDANQGGTVTFAESGSDAAFWTLLGRSQSDPLTVAWLLEQLEDNTNFEVRTGQSLTYTTDQLILLPRTNVEVKVEIAGTFYTLPLVSLTDTNFWSVKYAFLANLAGQFKHEVSQRNKAGANELLLRINEQLVELNMDEIDAEDIDSEFIQIEG